MVVFGFSRQLARCRWRWCRCPNVTARVGCAVGARLLEDARPHCASAPNSASRRALEDGVPVLGRRLIPSILRTFHRNTRTSFENFHAVVLEAVEGSPPGNRANQWDPVGEEEEEEERPKRMERTVAVHPEHRAVEARSTIRLRLHPVDVPLIGTQQRDVAGAPDVAEVVIDVDQDGAGGKEADPWPGPAGDTERDDGERADGGVLSWIQVMSSVLPLGMAPQHATIEPRGRLTAVPSSALPRDNSSTERRLAPPAAGARWRPARRLAP